MSQESKGLDPNPGKDIEELVEDLTPEELEEVKRAFEEESFIPREEVDTGRLMDHEDGTY